MAEMTLEERVTRLEAIADRDAKASADLADFCKRLSRALSSSFYGFALPPEETGPGPRDRDMSVLLDIAQRQKDEREIAEEKICEYLGRAEEGYDEPIIVRWAESAPQPETTDRSYEMAKQYAPMPEEQEIALSNWKSVMGLVASLHSRKDLALETLDRARELILWLHDRAGGEVATSSPPAPLHIEPDDMAVIEVTEEMIKEGRQQIWACDDDLTDLDDRLPWVFRDMLRVYIEQKAKAAPR